MLKKIIKSFRRTPSSHKIKANRQYARRIEDRCVAIVNGKMYPVENWSSGGVLFTADDRFFSVGQEYPLILKFKLRERLLDVPHAGKIVRKQDNKVAVQFEPISQMIQSRFQQVVDDYVAQRFAESQRA